MNAINSTGRPAAAKIVGYTWYWKAPFNNRGFRPPAKLGGQWYFDRERWWESRPKQVSLESATYELARRHPSLGACLRYDLHLHDPAKWPLTAKEEDALRPVWDRMSNSGGLRLFLVTSWTKPWVKLSKGDREFFAYLLASEGVGNTLIP